MTFGPNQGPPQVPSIEEQEKENKKRFIEKALENFKSAGFPVDCIKMIHRVIKSRITFEVLKKIEENPEEALEKYGVGKEEKMRDFGVHINQDNILEDIWVPKKFIEEQKSYFDDLLVEDEINVLQWSLNTEDKKRNTVLADRVLRCRTLSESGMYVSMGRKVELLFKNKEYRDEVKNYVFMVNNIIKNFSSKMLSMELPEHTREACLENKDNISRVEEDAFKAIEYLTSIYLEEMK